MQWLLDSSHAKGKEYILRQLYQKSSSLALYKIPHYIHFGIEIEDLLSKKRHLIDLIMVNEHCCISHHIK